MRPQAATYGSLKETNYSGSTVMMPNSASRSDSKEPSQPPCSPMLGTIYSS